MECTWLAVMANLLELSVLRNVPIVAYGPPLVQIYTFYLSIYLLEDIWVVSALQGALITNLLWTFVENVTLFSQRSKLKLCSELD